MFISQMLESNRLTGGAPFVEEIELRRGIRLEFKRPGGPAKEQKDHQLNKSVPVITHLLYLINLNLAENN
jgi:hypothetical protein